MFIVTKKAWTGSVRSVCRSGSELPLFSVHRQYFNFSDRNSQQQGPSGIDFLDGQAAELCHSFPCSPTYLRDKHYLLQVP